MATKKPKKNDLDGLAAREAAPSTKDKSRAWDIVLKCMSQLELMNEPLSAAVKKHERLDLVPRLNAFGNALNLCVFYAQACDDGEDMKKELGVCCTIAASLYSRHPD